MVSRIVPPLLGDSPLKSYTRTFPPIHRGLHHLVPTAISRDPSPVVGTLIVYAVRLEHRTLPSLPGGKQHNPPNSRWTHPID
jgi:hypothetical protein